MAERENARRDQLDHNTTPTPAVRDRLPGPLLSFIAQAPVETVVAMLRTRPELRNEIFTAIHQTRGNAFAEQVARHSQQSAASRGQEIDGSSPSHEETNRARRPPLAPQVADSGAEAGRGRHRLKYDPSFTQMALGSMSERSAPSNIILPPEIAKALDEAWQSSVAAGHYERGGNIVRKYSGDFGVRQGGTNYDDVGDHDTWDPDPRDLGVGQRLVGLMHTHPYDDPDLDHGSFSDSDLVNLTEYDIKLAIVRSGPYTYMVARTREFEAMLAEVEREKDHRALVFKREAFKVEMRKTFNDAMNAFKGSKPDRLEAGVKAVCQKYRLAYYAGQGQGLQRVATR